MHNITEGTLDGGDVLKVGRTVYGLRGRTDEVGITSSSNSVPDYKVVVCP